MTTASDLALRLEQHLEQEYEALVAGDLDKIEEYAEAKLRLLEEVSELAPTQIRQLDRLRSRLMRNHLLTGSAIRGMKAALDRARDIEAVSTSLRTYSERGVSQDWVSTGGHALSKKS